MKRSFTLIEMVVIIVIIGILSVIIIPNISSMKNESVAVQIKANKTNIQTAVDRYVLENNSFPTRNDEEPLFGFPKYLDEQLLYPEYTRNKSNEINYTIDYNGNIFASETKLPNNIIQDRSFVYWEGDSNNKSSYNIYELTKRSSSSAGNNYELSLIDSVTEELYHGEQGKRYAVSAVDYFGNETAPVISTIHIGEGTKEALELNGIDQHLEIDSKELMDLHNNGEITYEIYYFYFGVESSLLHRGTSSGYEEHLGCQYEPDIRTDTVVLSGCTRVGEIKSFNSKIGWNKLSVTLSKSGDKAKVYLNNKLIQEETLTKIMNNNKNHPSTFNSTVETLLVGAYSSVDRSDVPFPIRKGFLKGMISEFRIWDKALSDDEIILYNEETLTGREENLAGLWKFNEGSGNIVYDHVSNNHAVIINGGTWLE